MASATCRVPCAWEEKLDGAMAMRFGLNLATDVNFLEFEAETNCKHLMLAYSSGMNWNSNFDVDVI